MSSWFLRKEHLNSFVSELMKTRPVIAPVAKRTRFVFDTLKRAEDLRLDYDTTILPPKKVFLPTKQDLLKFTGKDFCSTVDGSERILFGVHPYDLKAIAMMDWIHEESNFDDYYHANRKATTIVGSSVQNHYKRAFFGSVCTEKPVSGQDMFLTAITDGFHVDVVTLKGEKLLPAGKFEKVTAEQTAEAKKVNADALANCPQKLNGTSFQIKHKVRLAYDSDIWEKTAKDCFSCGSCNIVCPTCYCFDIQDEWNLDGVSGTRHRRWDACLTCEFSEVTLQGATENFRDDRHERYRHRIMRKTSFLNDKLGGPACVGCGRCAGACTADIADPVRIVNQIMES